MRPAPSFHLDLRHDAVPVIPRKKVSGFAGTTPPAAGFDPERGLRFPLPPGSAFIFPGDGRISDARGALRVTFSFDESDAGGQLVDSWAGYLRLSARKDGDRTEIEVFAYGHFLRLLLPCRCHVSYTLALDWDCRTGMSMSLHERNTLLRMTGRNITWHAYRQKYIPIAIGGKLADTRPGHRNWIGIFSGWISEAACFRHPLTYPGVAPQVESPRMAPVPARATPLPLPSGVTLVELHDPPVHDSALRFNSIPDRLANLKQCRKAHPELAEHYHAAPNAFEGLLRVARTVGNLWPHTEYWPWPREIFTERGDRLLTRIKAGQTAGMCGGFAHTMEEALWALGVPARRTQVWHHSSLEAYDHHHDKWICLETDNHVGHAGCWIAPDDTPYCIGELIDILEQDRHEPGTAYQQVRFLPLGNACPSGADNGPHPFSWLRACYVMMGYAHRHADGVKSPAQWFYHSTPAVRLDPPHPDPQANRERQVDDWRDLYWSCDRLQVRTTWIKSRHSVKVTAKPFQAQFFNGCVARLDGRKPRCIGTDYEWVLHPGENRLELAAINKLGAIGHPWRAVLRVD
jgi:hypothetical protein